VSTTNSSTPPDALMLLGTHCPHCPTVLSGLAALVKAGTIGTLKIINIEQRPDLARELGVRTVPWVRLGVFELEGLHSEKELKKWAENASSAAGMAAWLDELLSNGNVGKATRLVQSSPDAIDALLELFADPEIQLNTRIGISAIIEELQDSSLLQAVVEKLGALTRHKDARIRGDACHYLALSGAQQAVRFIQPLLQDEDPETKELAEESLQRLEDL
jgi:thioredoxin-like negative regulator of GroEL